MAAKLSGSGGGKYDIEQNAEINVTPFVDVMLVLLIIFMVAAPLATVSVKVDLPPAVAMPSPNPPKPIYISIQKRWARLHRRLPDGPGHHGRRSAQTQIGTRDPTKERIYIRGDKDTIYGDFMNVMNKLQDNGFYSVALIGTDQRGGRQVGLADAWLTNSNPHEHHHYDPLTADRPPRRRGAAGSITAVTVAVVFHAGIGFYVWKAKFEPKYQEFSDQAVKVSLLEAASASAAAASAAAAAEERAAAAAAEGAAASAAAAAARASRRRRRCPSRRRPRPVRRRLRPAAEPPQAAVRSPTRTGFAGRTRDDLAEYYPERAQRMNQAGSAKMTCTVTASGTLYGLLGRFRRSAGSGFR